MSFPFKKQSVLLIYLCVILVFSQVAFAGDADWREVTPAELAMKTSKVEPDADAEAIFWEVRINDSATTNLTLEHYVRVKIFTERGREKFSKIDIPFTKRLKIKDIAARVIKPDGSIFNLKPEDIFEREIIKSNDVKVKAKSFAVPNIEEGVILEYQYREVISRGIADNMPIIFQRDIPIQESTYYVKPSKDVGQGMKWIAFNVDSKFVKDKGGFYKATLRNVPAVKEEPRMPPEDQVRSWGLIYYDEYFSKTSGDFWSRFGGALSYAYDIKDVLKTSKDEKNLAAEITSGAKTDEEKVSRIFEYCRTKIKNLTYDTSLTEEQLDEIKENKSPKDTLKKGQGRAGEINELFAALVSTLDLETRIAFTGDRSKIFFSQQHAHPSFVHAAAVAVRYNNNWNYFDPGTPFVPYGMLAWFEEDQVAFLLDNETYVRTSTPISDPEKSLAKRTGRFTLHEDGTLEGTVEIEYSGHFAYSHKFNNYDESVSKREEILKESVQKRLSSAEITNISVENAGDYVKPFVYKYKIKVPNYAQKTGKRMFLQPGFFEYGKDPEFSTDSRKYGIYFHFPWSEQDDIQITLPKGYSLDSADSPTDINDNQRIGQLKVVMNIDTEKNILFYQRKFYFGKGGYYYFQPESYKAVKGLFDEFHKSNSHLLTLKSQ